MRKELKNKNFSVDIDVDDVKNGVSCVIELKSFVKPKHEDKQNCVVMEQCEKHIKKYTVVCAGKEK